MTKKSEQLTVTSEQVAWFVEDMRAHCATENNGMAVNASRLALGKARKKVIESLIGREDVLIAALTVTLSSWTGTKGQKQSYKRSWSNQYHNVHEDRQLVFKDNRPMVEPFEPVSERAWDEVIRDTMLEHGATEELVKATITTMQKIRDNNDLLLAETQQSIREALRKEKARTVEALKAQQKALEKELAALA